MNKIVLDTETTNFIENTTEDICTQLSFLNIDNSIILNDYCKPITYKEFTVGSMEATGITPEFLEDKPKVQDTKSWKVLDAYSKQDLLVIGHNINFDIEVIKRTGINVDKMLLIDTLKIARYINDAEGLPWESCRLSHLKYQFRLDKIRPTIDAKYGITEKLNSHDSLNDILDCLALYKYFQQKYEISEEEAIEISNNKLELIYVPSGKHKGTRIVDLDSNSLNWYKNNFYCEDTVYTIKKILGEL